MVLIKFNIETEFGSHFSEIKCIDMKYEDFMRWFRKYYYMEIKEEYDRNNEIIFRLKSDLELRVRETSCDDFAYIDNMITNSEYASNEIFKHY